MIPKTIKAGGHIYDVEVCDLCNNTGDLGDVNYHLTRIRIANHLSKSVKESTLLHEILHISFKLANYNPKNYEEIIDNLQEPLYQILKGNPDLFKGDK